MKFVSGVDPMHKYFFDELDLGYYSIMSEDTNAYVGTVYVYKQCSQPKFVVTNPVGEPIGFVDAFNWAIPVIDKHLEQARWGRDLDALVSIIQPVAPDRKGLRYVKETRYGLLWVNKVTHGRWVAYRNDYELLSDDKIAEFATREEAQRTADAHLHDGYSNSQVIKDGYSWCPLSIAERNHRNQEGEVFAGPKTTR